MGNMKSKTAQNEKGVAVLQKAPKSPYGTGDIFPQTLPMAASPFHIA